MKKLIDFLKRKIRDYTDTWLAAIEDGDKEMQDYLEGYIDALEEVTKFVARMKAAEKEGKHEV